MEFVLEFSVMLLQGLRSTWRRIVSIPRAWRGLVISVIFTATTLALLGFGVIICNSFGAIFWFLIFITSPRWRRLTALFLFLGTYTVSQGSHWRLGAHHRQEEEVVFLLSWLSWWSDSNSISHFPAFSTRKKVIRPKNFYSYFVVFKAPPSFFSPKVFYSSGIYCLTVS